MQINTKIEVAAAGEALIDLIRNDAGLLQPCLGGAVYNLTRALARQGVGTLYLNPLSRDRFGRQLAQGLADDGVQLAIPEPVQQVTSLAVVGVDDQGHPDYSFYREGVADRATTAAALTAACAQSSTLSLVCTGALALSPDDAQTYLPWLASQREARRTVVIDANLRPSVMPDLPAYRKHVLAALQYADVIKASDEDLACLDIPGSTALEQAAHLLRNSQAACLALTRGPDGATLLTRSGRVFHARESQPVVVVDTVGAGDCFLAGLVAALLDNGLASNWGEAQVEASLAQDLLSRAVASASLCIMQRGCVPPTRAEVQARRSATVSEFTQDATELAGASL
ncbi:PfkB family carbohydrate kinase [Rhodoferax sp. PAMC 29310]|uniref:PfkB family carbohydrate kinase n=1 Tax=Rhodoferax sp. PAMC 29310 TaxID=2822760 RepID=UPI001B31D0D9|nr:PfkB family carbohydrate kinase [Rhodoferax sp. PAMC 29310]